MLFCGLWWRRQVKRKGWAHTEEISVTCAHMASNLIHVTVIQTAHNLTETFSGYERTLSENDEEHLLLAWWFDLAPVWCGINGMGGSCSCERLAMHPCAFTFYILVFFTSGHLDIVYLSELLWYNMFSYACAGFLCPLLLIHLRVWPWQRNWCVYCMRVVLPYW